MATIKRLYKIQFSLKTEHVDGEMNGAVERIAAESFHEAYRYALDRLEEPSSEVEKIVGIEQIDVIGVI